VTRNGPAAAQTQDGLPRGWSWTTLGDVVELLRNGLAMAPREDFGVPILRISAVRPLRLDVSDLRYLPGDLADYEGYELEPGDLLFTRYNGNVALVGACAVVPEGTRGIVHPDKLIRVKVKALSPAFVAAAATVGRSREHITKWTRSTAGQAGISGSDLKQMPLPVGPLNEQRRIVDALDSYLTRLEAASEGLKRVEANLKRYRASVLRAAVEGRLVPNEAELAKKEGRSYEPAAVLLSRVLRERRSRWVASELAKMEAKGELAKSDEWTARYDEPAAPDATSLPDLPEGWCWSTVDQLADVQGGIQKGKQRQGSERLRDVPYLRVANVQRGFLDLGQVRTIAASDDEIERLQLQPGDVLFNEGGDRDKLGRGWVWSGEIGECIHQNHVFRARLWTSDYLPKLLSWYGNSSGQKYFFDEGKQTTNLASLNSTKLRRLPVPVPPNAEQAAISTEVERHLSEIDSSDNIVRASLQRLSRLRQAILKWAFEGKLVEQDPKDEPASVLLDRIRQERASAATEAKRSARAPARKIA
jgi:type I restriction enzyme, S subunit